MKKRKEIINVCVHPNQNEITKREGEKIRRIVKRFFPDYRVKMNLNVSKKFAEDLEGNKITFSTTDVNYNVNAFVIELQEVTNVDCYDLYCQYPKIKIN